jgi:DNA-binding NtrC family response regulator
MQDKSIIEDTIYKILLVGIKGKQRKAISGMFASSQGLICEIQAVKTSDEALDVLDKQEFDLVLSDYKLPKMSGPELLIKINEDHPDILRMVFVGQENLDKAKRAYANTEITNYVINPLNSVEAMILIESALKRKTERENQEKLEFQNVTDAIKSIHQFQKELEKVDPESIINKKPKLMWEFKSPREFNKFSFEIKKMENCDIEDIYIFENKYILTVEITPVSLKRVR